MSVYRDTEPQVVFDHPFPGPLTATVYRDGTKVARFDNVVKGAPNAGKFTLPLTWRETSFDGELEIVWRGLDRVTDRGSWNPSASYVKSDLVAFEDVSWVATEDSTGVQPGYGVRQWEELSAANGLFERTQTVDVVTPLVKLSELKTCFSTSNMLEAELTELERNVRLVVQAYTGQRFGYEVGSKQVTGTGEKKIALPQRLARLHTVKGGPAGYFSVSADGWSLHASNKNWLTIKEMPPEEFIDNVQLVSGVIHVPDSYWKQFRAGTVYTITGEWGYTSVPENVQEAALLLANDFGSGENLYRDRYLDVVKSGDWNLAFNSLAWRGTGNARADDLLKSYRREGMVII